jgi:hypothetical protein
MLAWMAIVLPIILIIIPVVITLIPLFLAQEYDNPYWCLIYILALPFFILEVTGD